MQKTSKRYSVIILQMLQVLSVHIYCIDYFIRSFCSRWNRPHTWYTGVSTSGDTMNMLILRSRLMHYPTCVPRRTRCVLSASPTVPRPTS